MVISNRPMDAPSPFLIYARKGRYILNGNIRETIDELDRKVLTIFNKLPLSNFIREIVNHFHFKVRESIDDLDLDIGIIFNNAYLPTETNLSKIPSLDTPEVHPVSGRAKTNSNRQKADSMRFFIGLPSFLYYNRNMP